ncbi:MAG: hypothetical protein ACJ8BW_18055 [Ktedonobacteraceae bacterium]
MPHVRANGSSIKPPDCANDENFIVTQDIISAIGSSQGFTLTLWIALSHLGVIASINGCIILISLPALYNGIHIQSG